MPDAPPEAGPHPTAEPAPVSGSAMTAEDLERIWETQIVGKLRPVAAGLFRDATVVDHERNVVTVRLGEGVPLAQARRRSNEVEPILSALLDQTIRLEVTDSGSALSPLAPTGPAPPQSVPSTSTGEASSSAAQHAAAASPTAPAPSQEAVAPATSHEAKVQRIVERFPGSVVVRDDEGTT